jgi:hypothetical protein
MNLASLSLSRPLKLGWSLLWIVRSARLSALLPKFRLGFGLDTVVAPDDPLIFIRIAGHRRLESCVPVFLARVQGAPIAD